jgi:hypothetical protein
MSREQEWEGPVGPAAIRRKVELMGSTTGQSTVPRRIGTERPWALPPERVAADLGTDPVVDLPEGEAASRLARFGGNVLVELARKPTWRLMAEQFANTVIVVLLVAAGSPRHSATSRTPW